MTNRLNLLSDYFSTYPLFDLQLSNDEERNKILTPACDIQEGKNHFLLTLEMPGVKKEDITIETRDQELIISGERKREEKHSEKGSFYTERRFGRFERSFTLPKTVNSQQIEAHYENGMLRVAVPKAEAVKPKVIKIADKNESQFLSKWLTTESEANNSSRESQLAS